MTNTEMLEILRGKVLHESPEAIQQRLNEIADALEQLMRERDAAVADLKESTTDDGSLSMCYFCKYQYPSDHHCHGCGGYLNDTNWEWRGVQDEAD